MARLAVAVAVLAACGDNAPPPAPCEGVALVFAYTVPLHAIVRPLPGGGLALGGTFRDTVDLGGHALTSAGGTDVFVARITAGGAIEVASFGDAEDQELLALATTGAGDLAIAGRFRGTLDLGGGALAATGTTSSLFVASLRPDGGHRWSRAFPVETILRALAISPAGDVAIAGTHFDPLDLGGGVLPTGGQFLGVLDAAAGAHVTSRALALEDQSVNLDVGLAFAGDDLLAAGSFTNTIDLGGGPLASAGALDLYVARFGRDGASRATRRLGGPANDGFRGFDGDRVAIAAVPDGLVLATGTQPDLEAPDDVRVLRLDHALATTWDVTFPLADVQAVGALAIATDGTIAIAGLSAGATDPGTPAACGAEDASHAFATTLDPGGRVRWTHCFPAGFAAVLSAAFRDPTELVLAGTFMGTLELGTAQLASEDLSGFVAGVRPTCE